VLGASLHVGLYANGAVYMVFFVLLMISYSVVLYALVVNAAFNVIIATIFHLMINVTNLFSYSVINETGFMMVNALVWGVIAVLVIIAQRSVFGIGGGRTSSSSRQVNLA
jgi:hypothetical protein